MREGKCCFNPCLFNGYVYVCGEGSHLVEVFSPQTDNFIFLSLQLPEAHSCCLFVHHNLLTVHSYLYISKFSAGQAGQLIQHSLVNSQEPADKYFNSQPMIDVARGLFFILQCGHILSFDIETGMKVLSFS